MSLFSGSKEARFASEVRWYYISETMRWTGHVFRFYTATKLPLTGIW